MSFFNPFSWFASTVVPTVEADLVKVLAAVKGDVAVAEADIVKGLNWVAANAPTIVSDLQLALSLAQGVGGVSAPVLAAANMAVTALNAFARAHTAAVASGNSALVVSASSVVAGYQAFTSAQAAVSQAKADAAASATKKAV